MILRLFNLMLAISMAVLFSPLLFGESKGPNPMLYVIIVFLAAWLAGSVGLFFRKRWAWIASLQCAALLLVFSIGMLAHGTGLLSDAGDSNDGRGVYLGTAVVFFLVSTTLLFGLIVRRKQLLVLGQSPA